MFPAAERAVHRHPTMMVPEKDSNDPGRSHRWRPKPRKKANGCLEVAHIFAGGLGRRKCRQGAAAAARHMEHRRPRLPACIGALRPQRLPLPGLLLRRGQLQPPQLLCLGLRIAVRLVGMWPWETQHSNKQQRSNSCCSAWKPQLLQCTAATPRKSFNKLQNLRRLTIRVGQQRTAAASLCSLPVPGGRPRLRLTPAPPGRGPASPAAWAGASGSAACAACASAAPSGLAASRIGALSSSQRCGTPCTVAAGPAFRTQGFGFRILGCSGVGSRTMLGDS